MMDLWLAAGGLWQRVLVAILRGSDKLLPESLRRGDTDTLRRARLAVGASLILVGCGLMTSALLLTQGPIENLPVALGAVAGGAAVPLLLRRTKSVQLAGQLIPTTVFVALGVAAWRCGGQLALPYIVLPSVPVAAILIVGLRAGVAWGAISIGGLGILAVAMNAGLEPAMPLDAAAVETSFFRGSLIALPFMMLCVYAAESARERTLKRVFDAQLEERHRADELERANRTLEEFTYAAAHELKEPLRGLNSCAGFLIADCRDQLGGEALRRAETVQRLAERLDARIETLRRISEIKREKLQLQRVEVQQVVEEALDALADRIEACRARIRLEAALSGTEIDCDRMLLAGLFEDLVEHALALDPSPEPCVVVGCRQDGKTSRTRAAAVFFVRNERFEIPQARVKDFFRPFKRTSARAWQAQGQAEADGRMAIVRRIIEAHGGRVWLESAPGEGTTVYFRLGEDEGLDGRS